MRGGGLPSFFLLGGGGGWSERGRQPLLAFEAPFCYQPASFARREERAKLSLKAHHVAEGVPSCLTCRLQDMSEATR